MRPLPRFGLAILVTTFLFGASATAAPVELLPSFHLLYEDLESLASRGDLGSFPIHARPLARVDVARALIQARDRDPDIASDLHWQRLARELAREFLDLEAAPPFVESGPLVDVGPREQRFRVAMAGHARGDYDSKRAVHARLRDESSAAARLSLQIWPSLGAYEEFGVTRIRGQREFIDAIAEGSDLETAVLRGEVTARVHPITIAAGYESVRWGPGRRGTLLLSDAAGPMTFLLFQGAVRGETVGVTGSALSAVISAADHAYLAAHRIDLTLSPRWSIGLSEAARYTSDGLDPLYVLGTIPYTVIERIRVREASNDSLRTRERANVMASADVSFRATRDLTLYGELLVDDYATESADMPNRIGYQLGFRSDRPWGDHAVHFQGEYTRVRNYTYSVYYGENFSYRGRPLGFALGPDVENVYLEAFFDITRDWQLRWSGDFTNHGEGRLDVPWLLTQGGISTAGLSGVVEERREVWGDARWMPRDNVDVSVGLGFRRVRNDTNIEGADRESWLARFSADLRY